LFGPPPSCVIISEREFPEFLCESPSTTWRASARRRRPSRARLTCALPPLPASSGCGNQVHPDDV